jgi:hypothetical protein
MKQRSSIPTDNGELRRIWSGVKGLETLQPYSVGALSPLGVPRSVKDVLAEAGLPRSAAPFLSFGEDRAAAPRSAAETLALSEEEMQDLGLAPPDLERYRVIGSDGSGNLICLDERSKGAVVIIDHERPDETMFLNSSPRHLLLSLVAYQKRFHEASDSEAHRNQAKKRAGDDIKRIDESAMRPGAFWREALFIEGQDARLDLSATETTRDLDDAIRSIDDSEDDSF